MKEVEILEGEDWHLNPVLGNLRKEDYEEVKAATGEDPDQVLSDAWLSGGKRWAISYAGDIIGLFGLKDDGKEGIGIPWLLGTDGLKSIKKAFLGKSMRVVAGMLNHFPVLINFVDARNKMSIRWLKWCGFDILEPIRYGAERKLFHPFIMRR